jgi:FkbH-like protein
MKVDSSSALTAALARLSRDPGFGAHLTAASALDELGPAETGLPELRVAVLRNFTVEPLLPVVKAQIALAGFHPVLYVGDFDAVARDALDAGSPLYGFRPDVVIVSQWLEPLAPALVRRFPSLSSEEVEGEVERVRGTVEQVVSGIRRHSDAPVLLNNFPLSAHPAMGILDAQSAGYQSGTVLRINGELLAVASAVRDVYLVDYLGLVARVGAERAVDERRWQSARAPLGRELLVPLGREYAKFVRALRGRVRKCLVLDCDNTLWGGVVGEDGLEGLRLGDTGPGAAYQALQRGALNLRDRGVILALCSKNNEVDVLEVLRGHPGMLIREADCVAAQVNWEDKPTNLRRLAEQLNIGLDSIVFVDDSEFECDLVRAHLPEVAVVQVPADPSEAVVRLLEAGWFDSLTVSAEDRLRSEMYRAEARRREIQSRAGSLEEYLSGLGLVADIGAAGPSTVPRVAQLTQKTNQFNLTTRRYTEGEIAALTAREDAAVFHLSLRDRVADLGIVGVAIVRFADERAEIDTFLLSCRALGRGAEEALLAQVLIAALRRGCTHVEGRYAPTARNAQVADFYPRHGFRAVADGPDGSRWELELGPDPAAGPAWIHTNFAEEVIHAGE